MVAYPSLHLRLLLLLNIAVRRSPRPQQRISSLASPGTLHPESYLHFATCVNRVELMKGILKSDELSMATLARVVVSLWIIEDGCR